MIFYKDKTYYLQLSLIDLNGNFVISFASGESVDYIIRKSSDGSVIDSGEMIIDGNIWKVEWTPTIVGEYSIEYITPENYENGTETIVVEEYDNFKADVSDLALEDTLNTKASQDSVDEIKTTVENLDLELDGVAKETTSQEILEAVGDISGGLTVEQDAMLRRILGLSQENYRIFNPVYDVNSSLTSATIKIYNTASDCEANINPIATYQLRSGYDVQNRMNSYKVKKI